MTPASPEQRVLHCLKPKCVRAASLEGRRAAGAKAEDLIPDEGLAMIRYHSCYPWHTANEYGHFMAEGDQRIKEWVQEFNKFDLYTKSEKQLDEKELWPYSQGLIDKFCPGKLCW